MLKKNEKFRRFSRNWGWCFPVPVQGVLSPFPSAIFNESTKNKNNISKLEYFNEKSLAYELQKTTQRIYYCLKFAGFRWRLCILACFWCPLVISVEPESALFTMNIPNLQDPSFRRKPTFCLTSCGLLGRGLLHKEKLVSGVFRVCRTLIVQLSIQLLGLISSRRARWSRGSATCIRPLPRLRLELGRRSWWVVLWSSFPC